MVTTLYQYPGFNEGGTHRLFDHNGDRIPVRVVVVDPRERSVAEVIGETVQESVAKIRRGERSGWVRLMELVRVYIQPPAWHLPLVTRPLLDAGVTAEEIQRWAALVQAPDAELQQMLSCIQQPKGTIA